MKKLCRRPGRDRGRSATPCLLLALLALLAPALATPPAASAETPGGTERERKTRELEELRARMQAVERQVTAVRSNMSVLQQALADEERRIGALANRIREAQQRGAGHRERLQDLEQRRRALQGARDAQGAALGDQIRSAYILGRQNYLKVLLNQEDPATLSRVLTYHQYMTRERARQLEALRRKVQRLAAVEGAIREESAALAALQERLRREKTDLEAARERRRATLAALEGELADGTRRLEHLQATGRELEALIQRLGEALADIPSSLDRRRSFAEMTGRLSWPLDARIRHGFGTGRGIGNLSWQGVVFDAREGDPVRAVYHGRVAFAGWLRGFGMLVILDHGDGYMSLYGHNQSLLKETGDWVDTGEVVATAGASGGRARPGLYFEIRRNASPLDPVRWCRAPSGS